MTYTQLRAIAQTVCAEILPHIHTAMADLSSEETTLCWGLIRDLQAQQAAFDSPKYTRVRFERSA